MKFLTGVPQTYRHPYILYGTIIRLLRVPIAIIHLLGWVHTLRHHPFIALGFLAFYIYSMAPTHRAFWATYPYMFSPCNVLAAVASDFSSIPVGLWGFLTLSTDSWVHGDGITAKKQPGITTAATRKVEALAHTTSDAASQLLAGMAPPTGSQTRTESQAEAAALPADPCHSSGNPMEQSPDNHQSKEVPMISLEGAKHTEEAESKKEQ